MAHTKSLFRTNRPIVGMIHLRPLPGSPGYGGSLDPVFRRAAADAEILVEEGVDGLMVENFGDTPFHKDRVPPVTIASMSVLIERLRVHVAGKIARIRKRRTISAPVWGVNVLRNDARAALSIAAATGAGFIRVNVHTGASVTDQGLIEGQAAETLRLRESIAPQVAIFADLRVKHARPLVARPLVEEVADLAERGLADAILLTGARTGTAPDPEEIAEARLGAAKTPLWIASGVSTRNVSGYLEQVDGLIVGSSLKRGGRASGPVDRPKTRALLRAAGRTARRTAR